jgi:hypothetical protein
VLLRRPVFRLLSVRRRENSITPRPAALVTLEMTHVESGMGPLGIEVLSESFTPRFISPATRNMLKP